MVFADYLVEFIAENAEEVLVRRHHRSVEVKLDDRLYPVKCLIDGQQVAGRHRLHLDFLHCLYSESLISV